MLRIYKHDFKILFKRQVSYLSNDFNQLMIDSNKTLIENSVNINLNIFIERENQQQDILDQLKMLRRQKDATSVTLFPSVIIKKILDSISHEEVVHVLRDPLKYGVFLDTFSACYLLNHFLNNKQLYEAVLISAEVVNQGIYDSKILRSLSLISCYEYLQNKASNPVNPKVTDELPTEMVKIRVKYVRNESNTYQQDQKKETIVGKTILALLNMEDKKIRINFELIGHILTGNKNELMKCLSLGADLFHKDVLELCFLLLDTITCNDCELMKKEFEAEIRKCKNEIKFLDVLYRCLKIGEDEANNILLAYKGEFSNWLENYNKTQIEYLKQKNNLDRKRNIENIFNNLKTTQENLWFFENEDEIAIRAFKKQVFYPKRWFGKKKKPRVVDSFYVPPEISRKSQL